MISSRVSNDVGQGCIPKRARFETLSDGTDERQKCAFAPGRERKHYRVQRRRKGDLRQRRFLEDDVGIGARPSEGADACAPQSRRVPRHGGLRHLERSALEGNVRVQPCEQGNRWNRAVLQCECDLDHSCDASRTLQVTDIPLDRTEGHRNLVRGTAREHCGQRLDLDGIADRCTGAVRLQIGEVSGT